VSARHGNLSNQECSAVAASDYHAIAECERVADGNVLAKAPAKDISGRLRPARYRWSLLTMPK
jgi:hypothetical protein